MPITTSEIRVIVPALVSVLTISPIEKATARPQPSLANEFGQLLSIESAALDEQSDLLVTQPLGPCSRSGQIFVQRSWRDGDRAFDGCAVSGIDSRCSGDRRGGNVTSLGFSCGGAASTSFAASSAAIFMSFSACATAMCSSRAAESLG